MSKPATPYSISNILYPQPRTPLAASTCTHNMHDTRAQDKLCRHAKRKDRKSSNQSHEEIPPLPAFPTLAALLLVLRELRGEFIRILITYHT